jgi:hypothetical protein
MLNIQSIISSVGTQAGIDLTQAETAIGTILSIVQHEAPEAQVSQLFSQVDGASDLANKYDVTAAAPAAGGGLFGQIEGMLGGALGGKVGALLNGITQLKNTGLSVAQIEATGQALLAEVKQSTGSDVMSKLVASVPGLGGHLGA